MTLGVKCDDVLRDNDHLYAIKARKKKIALVRIEVTNPQSSNVQVVLSKAKGISPIKREQRVGLERKRAGP